jgi:hypothetical protein
MFRALIFLSLARPRRKAGVYLQKQALQNPKGFAPPKAA